MVSKHHPTAKKITKKISWKDNSSGWSLFYLECGHISQGNPAYEWGSFQEDYRKCYYCEHGKVQDMG